MPSRVAVRWNLFVLVVTLFAGLAGAPVHIPQSVDTGCATVTAFVPDGDPPDEVIPPSKPPRQDGAAILASTVPDGRLDPAGWVDDRDDAMPPGRWPDVVPGPA